MRKHIIFCCVFIALGISNKPLLAQQQTGQIVVNGGVGYSPEFDGQISILSSYPWYPVSTILGVIDNYQSYDFPSAFSCSSITPNMGGTLDVGIVEYLSAGVAASYQSEVVNWIVANHNYPSPPTSYPYSDEITRVNLALRFLAHLPIELTSKYVDYYIGVRIGESRWHDSPSAYNLNYPYAYSPSAYFITKPEISVASFQTLVGFRVYPIYNVGIHGEIGVGSPYLAEGGISFRINTRKIEVKSNPVTPMGE